MDERTALDALFSLTYEELRRLAGSVLRDDANASLTPTSLVNEAWLKLARNPAVANTTPLHFKRIAARAMRQVLVEAARRRTTLARGSGGLRVTFDESLLGPASASGGKDILALDHALERLGHISPRQAKLVEGHFFGGLDFAESAALLEVSEATVMREWRSARAWLAREVRLALSGPGTAAAPDGSD